MSIEEMAAGSNATRIPITPENLQGEDKYCSYVRAYFTAKGLTIGDTWIAHEYQSWILDKHSKFREMINCPCYMGYDQEQRTAFEQFILLGVS